MFKHQRAGAGASCLSAGINAVIQRPPPRTPANRYADVATMLAELRLALGIAPSSGAALAHGGSPSATIPPATGGTTTGGRRSTYETNVIYLPTFFEPIGDQLVFDNPYKGLRAFQEADASDFFGRDALIDTLVDRLNQPGPFQRFLAVVGPSGSGKSSVVRAGVVPALKQGAIPGSDKCTSQFFPARAFEELAQALLHRRRPAQQPRRRHPRLRAAARGRSGGARRRRNRGRARHRQFEAVHRLKTKMRTLFLDSLITAVTDPLARRAWSPPCAPTSRPPAATPA